MDALQLVDKLNGYSNGSPMWWTRLDAQTWSAAFEDVAGLTGLFQQADPEQRKSIGERLTLDTKLILARFTESKAVEVRRTRSNDALIQGLIPIVMAGGRSDTRTGAFVLSLILDSAQKSGLDAAALFAYAAQFAISEESAAQIRGFPSLPPALRDIRRFGIREKQTPEGVIYQMPGEQKLSWWHKWLWRQRLIHWRR